MSFHKANKQNKKLKAIGLWISTPVYKTTHYPEEPYLSVLLCYLRGEKKLLHAVNLNRYKNAHKSSCQRTLTYSPTLGYADRSSVPPPPELVPYPLAGGGRGGDYALVSKSLYFTPEAGISGFIYQVAWERIAFIGWDFYFILWCSSLPKNRRVFRQTLSH